MSAYEKPIHIPLGKICDYNWKMQIMHQIDFVCLYISSLWVACLKAFLSVSFEINTLQNIQRWNRKPNIEVITSGAPGIKEYWNSIRSLILCRNSNSIAVGK